MANQTACRVVLTVLVVCVTSHGAGARATATPSAQDLLDRYDRGDRLAVVSTLESLPGSEFEPLAKDFERVAGAWTSANGAEALEHRRLVAATLALELARAGLDTQWRVLRRLVALGSELVCKNPPGDVEHLWQWSAVALGGGARDDALLTINQGYLSKPFDLIGRARKQFPSDPRFRLAEAVVEEFPYVSERRRDEWRSDDELSAMGSLGEFELKRRALIRGAAQAFKPLLTVPEVGAEAHMRMGHAWLLLHQPTAAIASFRESTRLSDDPAVTYLAYLFAGRALEMLERPQEAELAYRQALTTVPRVQSGVEALANRLFLSGKPDEAYALVRSSFEAQPTPPDLWRLYGFGDYRRWPDLITRLRRELK